MQVGISNIGWQPDVVSKNTEIALNLGFDYIESAYIKAPLSKSVYAIQGVFYYSGISSFLDPSCYDHLCKVVDYCLKNNVKIITLGSPSMRVGSKNKMIELLVRIDEYINKRDCIICIEPNARKYGGEYYYTVDEIVDDIGYLYNIKTMIDSGNLYLEGLNPIVEFKKHKELWQDELTDEQKNIFEVYLRSNNIDKHSSIYNYLQTDRNEIKNIV